MTIELFLSSIERIYGAYENKAVKQVVAGYLKKDIKPDEIKSVYNAILYNHKVNFGVPCIATIEESIESAIKKKNTFSPYLIKSTNTKKYDYRAEAAANPEEYKEIDPNMFRKLKEKVKG